MLQWNDLHPYNAVHVAGVPAALEMERLRQVILQTLEMHGLAALTVKRESGTFQYHGGAAHCEIKVVTGGGDPSALLAAEVERQLNTPFALGDRIDPFRCFILPAADSFSLGVAYFHAMAGAESLVLLMQDLVNAYLGRAERGLSRPVELYPDSYGGWLRRNPGVLARKLKSIPSLLGDMRRSCRPPYRDAQDLRNGFTVFSLSAEDLGALTAAGKAWGATLNDLFLAVLMKSLAPLVTGRTQTSHRRRISVGSIVNIRKDLGVESRRTFGLFLGSFLVSHEVPEAISVKALASDVRRQTLAIKEDHRYMGTPLELALGGRFLALLSAERKRKFYQKYYPLWGGVTNMNLNTIWPQPAGEKPIDYLRAVSTGPATPLVLSITTVGEVVNIGVSYRTTVFSADDIGRIKREFVENVKQLRCVS